MLPKTQIDWEKMVYHSVTFWPGYLFNLQLRSRSSNVRKLPNCTYIESSDGSSNDHKFSERRLAALITYIRNVYPQGSQLGRELDPFVLSIIRGVPAIVWPTAALLSTLSSYNQQDERFNLDFSEDWQRTDLPNEFYSIL